MISKRDHKKDVVALGSWEVCVRSNSEMIFSVHNFLSVCMYFIQGLVKPDIVFFGEDLPDRFHSLQRQDFLKCDLLIVMGTSLEVRTLGC